MAGGVQFLALIIVAGAGFFHGSHAVTLPQPKGFWMFDRQNQGKDLSGNGNDAILSEVTNAPGPYGDEGGALEFAGTATSHAFIENTGDLDVHPSLTWMGWVYKLDTAGASLFEWQYKDSPTTWGVELWDFTSGNAAGLGFYPAYRQRGSMTNYPVAQTTNFFAVNEWVHVTAVFDNAAGQSLVYKNGVLDSSMTKSFTGAGLNSEGDVYIAVTQYASHTYYLHARVSCYQLYNEPLSQEQILLAMEKCKMKPDSNLPRKFVVELTTCAADEYLSTSTARTPQLTEFTVCHWAKVLKPDRYLHLMSLFHTGVINGIITYLKPNEGGYRILIQDTSIDIAKGAHKPNDGNWHYHCWTWVSETGLATIYEQYNGVWETIPGGTIRQGATVQEGYIIFMQDQDSPLGGLESSSCTYGALGGVDLWSYALTKSDLISQGCSKMGNIWSMTADNSIIAGVFDETYEIATCCAGVRETEDSRYETEPTINQVKFVNQNDMTLDNHVISEITTTTIAKCIRACLVNKDCKSINYIETSWSCELNSASDHDSSDLSPAVGSVHSSRWQRLSYDTSGICPPIS